jgi:hypothetical protein
MTDVASTLVGLRDVRGVEGSFLLLLPGGEVLTRDGLAVVTEASIADTSRRLSNMFQALESVCPGADEAVLRFDGLSLFARKSERVLLGVLAAETASMPALRMAANLVLRQLEGADLTPPPAPAPVPAEPAVADTPRRFWRGSPI